MSRRVNRLGDQTSPYLLQHRHNPVDWYPWGTEALSRARLEDRPIFLSIGYAACHWCHVMERESFENDEIAELLNRHFVPVKVDREERPDLDEIYMNAVQLLTGAGGWPLNVFLTPDLRPFTGGTYFPPEARHGLIGFPELLRRIARAWSADRERIGQAAEQLTGRLREMAGSLVTARTIEKGWDPTAQEARAAFELSQGFDARWGGFGGAPKFPADGGLALLLREHARSGEATSRNMVRVTLDRMALGGMYDHLGGGFARYSVDERWLVPHFEKMLYNQALLVPLYADAWKITRRPLYRRVVEQTLDFVRRELTHPEGGLYSSLDADSEGQEGKFYVWSEDEILHALGPEQGRWFNTVYGVTAAGNFEGRNILNLIDGSLEERAAGQGVDEVVLDDRLEPLRERLLHLRQERVPPATDDKILTAWNGLALTAFARAYQTFGRDEDLRSAERCARFVLQYLRREGRLLVSYRDGRAQLNAYLDDHAFFGRGLLDLYEAGFETRYLDAAEELAQMMVERFEDREHGGFFFTSDDHERLLVRNRSLHDGALPCGAGVAAELLLRLSRHLGRGDFRRCAERALGGARSVVERMPSGFAAVLHAAGWAAGPVVEVAVLGPADGRGVADLLAAARRPYVARLAIAAARGTPAGERPTLLADKPGAEGRAVGYVCRDFTCGAPTTDPAELQRAVETAARA